MAKSLEYRDPSKLLITGTALTPYDSYITDHVARCYNPWDVKPPDYPCSLRLLARTAAYLNDRPMEWWVDNQHKAATNANIINTDFYEETNLVRFAIRMNAGPVIATTRKIGDQPFALSSWKGEPVRLDVVCDTRPQLDLDYPPRDPPWTTRPGSTTSSSTTQRCPARSVPRR